MPRFFSSILRINLNTLRPNSLSRTIRTRTSQPTEKSSKLSGEPLSTKREKRMSQWVVAGLVSASGVATFFANQSGSASPEAANAAIDAAGHSIG